MSVVTTIIFLCFFSVTTHSFIPTTCSPSLKSGSALYLVPSQGCQLAAAYAAASVKDEDRSQFRDQFSDKSFSEQMNGKQLESSPQNIEPTHAAREFVSRLFSIPSNILPHGASNGQQSWLHNPFEQNEVRINENEDDVVLFPIVGFTIVTTEDDEMKVLPSHNTPRGSCNLESVRRARDLPLYGWFSPCCPLGHLYDDHESYCGEQNN